MDEMKTCILRLIVLSSLLSGTDTTNETIIVQPSLAVTLINDPAFFNCSTTSQEVEWLFGSEQYPKSFIIYSYGRVNEIYKDRFQVENYTYNNRKWFNLILNSTAKGDAGRYICRDPVNDEERKVHLTVLETEPACDSNLNTGGLIIGCGTKPETVQLSCSVRYNGEKIPDLQWIKTGESIVINSSLLECSDSGSIYTCNLTMESELQMEGDSYACQIQSMTRQYNCTSGVFRIIYVLGEHTELIGIVNDKVYYCSVNSSSQSCTSSWIFGNGTTNWTESHDHVIEFKRPGRFICQTICVFGNNNCTFTTMTVNVTVRAEPQETEPVCESNLNVSELIGPNSCGIKPETVQLSCSIRYIGDQFPELQWIKTGENIAINSSICSDSGNVYTCNLTIEPELQMEGSSYVCQTTQSMTRQYNCTSGPFRIIYALGNHTELHRTVNDNVNCSVNSNSQACTTSWIYDNGTTNWTVSHEQVIEFKRPGRFICQAIWVIRNKNCTLRILTVTVSAKPQDDDNHIVVIIVTVVVVVVAIVICAIIYYLWRRNIQNRKNASFRKDLLEMRSLLRTANAADASYRQDPLEMGSLLRTANAADSSRRQDIPVINPASPDVLIARENIFPKKITPMDEKNHDKKVRGLTVLDDELFVAYKESSIIEVFQVNSDMSSHKSVVVAELEDPGTIAACAKYSCLYVMDQISNSKKKIFKVKPDGEVINKWETDDDDKGRISVSRDGNVIMTVYDKGKVKIYSPDGTLLRDKTIDLSGMNRPITYMHIFHAINLADGTFIIAHGMYRSDVHQVLKINATGTVLRSFGNTKGSGDAELNCPAYVAERSDGSILVADQKNHRIIRLNSELEFVEILFKNEKCYVNRPKVMFVFEETETPLLFLGCNETSTSGGYVLVLRLSQRHN